MPVSSVSETESRLRSESQGVEQALTGFLISERQRPNITRLRYGSLRAREQGKLWERIEEGSPGLESEARDSDTRGTKRYTGLKEAKRASEPELEGAEGRPPTDAVTLNRTSVTAAAGDKVTG